jgi:hypothetical protein
MYTATCNSIHRNQSDSTSQLRRRVGAEERTQMSLAVTECKESADSVLERVIEYRPGWLKMK